MRTRPGTLLLAIGTGVLAVAACTSAATPGPTSPVASAPADAPAGASASPGIVITVTLTNAACTPDESTVPAGPTTFKVVNDGADKVSELELSRAGQTVAEKEDLAPEMSGSFVVDLSPGEYTLECPGATTDETPLHVTSG